MSEQNHYQQNAYQPVQQIAPGWYPDAQGAMRWWDGVQWTAHVQAPTYPNPERRRLSDSTPVDNAWVWLVALASFAFTPMLFLLDMRGYMASIMTGDPTGIINYFIWIIAMNVLSLCLWGFIAIAAYRDHKRLLSLGVERPFHWAFAFLGSTVYLIGRHIVLRKVLRTPGWPLWVHIAALVLYLIVVIVWTAWLMQVAVGDAMYYGNLYS